MHFNSSSIHLSEKKNKELNCVLKKYMRTFLIYFENLKTQLSEKKKSKTFFFNLRVFYAKFN